MIRSQSLQPFRQDPGRSLSLQPTPLPDRYQNRSLQCATDRAGSAALGTASRSTGCSAAGQAGDDLFAGTPLASPVQPSLLPLDPLPASVSPCRQARASVQRDDTDARAGLQAAAADPGGLRQQSPGIRPASSRPTGDTTAGSHAVRAGCGKLSARLASCLVRPGTELLDAFLRGLRADRTA